MVGLDFTLIWAACLFPSVALLEYPTFSRKAPGLGTQAIESNRIAAPFFAGYGWSSGQREKWSSGYGIVNLVRYCLPC